jgi:hypothetical protein
MTTSDSAQWCAVLAAQTGRMAEDDGDPVGRVITAVRLVWATTLVVDSTDQVLTDRWLMVHDGLRDVLDYLALAGRPVAPPEVDDQRDIPDTPPVWRAVCDLLRATEPAVDEFANSPAYVGDRTWIRLAGCSIADVEQLAARAYT